MSIQVNLMGLIPIQRMNFQHILPKNSFPKNAQELQKEETKFNIKGDVFTSQNIELKPLSNEELKKEKIEISSLNLYEKTTSSNYKDERTIVAFRIPNKDISKPDIIMAYKLDEKTIADLKSSFSSSDFFQRDDGILRLNGAVEKYISGWVMDIKDNRGYEKADANGNGVIDGNEAGELNISFDRHTDYSYLGEKIVSTNTNITGKRTYLKYSKTGDYSNEKYKREHPEDKNYKDMKDGILRTQTLKFKNTIRDELAHTIKLDKNKDGTITLEEGLEDYVPKGENLKTHFINKTESSHLAWVRVNSILLEPNILKHRNLPIETMTKKEREERPKLPNNQIPQFKHAIFPSKKLFDLDTHEIIKDELNNGPSKVLNYKTPKEAYLESIKGENITLVT